MNDIATRTTQLPDTLEDLSQFVLVSKAKLDAYKVKLRAVNRLSDAQEIREQTFQEAQEVANALIAAEARIGEILLSIPKNTSYHGNQHQEVTSSGVENTKNKSETISEMGYSKDQASDFQRMAQNPSVVNLVLEQAEREGDIVHVKDGCTKYRYDTYYEWLKDNIYDVDLLLGFERRDSVSTADVYTVVKIGHHEHFTDCQLAFIKRIDGLGNTYSYLFDISALEKVTKK